MINNVAIAIMNEKDDGSLLGNEIVDNADGKDITDTIMLIYVTAKKTDRVFLVVLLLLLLVIVDAVNDIDDVDGDVDDDDDGDVDDELKCANNFLC
jgi:hypothetical protein